MLNSKSLGLSDKIKISVNEMSFITYNILTIIIKLLFKCNFDVNFISSDI